MNISYGMPSARGSEHKGHVGKNAFKNYQDNFDKIFKKEPESGSKKRKKP